MAGRIKSYIRIVSRRATKINKMIKSEKLRACSHDHDVQKEKKLVYLRGLVIKILVTNFDHFSSRNI